MPVIGALKREEKKSLHVKVAHWCQYAGSMALSLYSVYTFAMGGTSSRTCKGVSNGRLTWGRSVVHGEPERPGDQMDASDMRARTPQSVVNSLNTPENASVMPHSPARGTEPHMARKPNRCVGHMHMHAGHLELLDKV